MRRKSSSLWLVIGLLLIAVGIASLFVPIPQERESGFTMGPIDVDVSREVSEPVNPVVSAVIIALGVAGVVAGLRK
ncbi:MAG: hypothetical protein KY432_10380 [Acidobacteria bacterium]|nr:hypothetical protein [Acidobacteriota bacterium]